MPLQKRFVRDGKNRVVASITSGFDDDSEVVRDEGNRIVGRSCPRYGVTRNLDNTFVSLNTADSGLLIRGKK
jgi:hypothetical protein